MAVTDGLMLPRPPAQRPHRRCLAKPRTGQKQAEMGWPTPFFISYAVQKVA